MNALATPGDPQSGPSQEGPDIPVPPDRDLLRLAQRLGRTGDALVISTDNPQVGDEESFWVTDLSARRTRQITARLELLTAHALWYVDSQVQVDTQGMAVAAQAYEQQIYPKLIEAFGELGLPPGGARLSILHTPLQGALGYVSGADRYPQAVHPYSNQRPMMYLDTSNLAMGSRRYLTVLAHELQHLIHGAADPTEEAWVNEGLSELATELAGYTSASMRISPGQGLVSLTLWPDSSQTISRHYATAFRFFRYFIQQHGGPQRLPLLLQVSQDGADGISAYLQRVGALQTFTDVFGPWTVANLLGEQGVGPYGYSDPLTLVVPDQTLRGVATVEGSVAPFAARYITVAPEGADATIEFRGQSTAAVIAAEPFSGDRCWWSNRGDAIHTRLEREVDLREVEGATLEFQARYAIEEEWDYAYVMVSADGGERWEILEGRHTVVENPLGNSFGPGYTGSSGGWLQERMDLTPYAGRQIHLSFEYVTDDAVNRDGLCVDDIAVPEIDFFDDAEAETGWTAEGFVRTDNRLPQEYLVYVVEHPADGSPRVRRMPLSAENTGSLRITGYGEEVEQVVVVLSSVTPATAQAAEYAVRVVE